MILGYAAQSFVSKLADSIISRRVPDRFQLGQINAVLRESDAAHFDVFASDTHIFISLLRIEQKNFSDASGSRTAEKSRNCAIFIERKRINIRRAYSDRHVDSLCNTRQA